MTRIAYFDCASGISGDMMLGALIDAGADLNQLNAAVGSLGLPGCRVVAKEVKKRGFRAVQIIVEYEAETKHRRLSEILEMIDAGRLSDRQKGLARRIFNRLAEAEAKVHGTSIEKVHFHEVGAADSIADVVGTAVGWDLLGIERGVASPIPVGTGKIKIAHGTCSIPGPATAELLRGIPLAESSVPFELTTPTGAAIVATLADSFGPMPPMTIEQIGCGSGERDLQQQPNLLRLLVGREAKPSGVHGGEEACILETNLDDISGEMIGYCTMRLWEAGALDVFTTAIGMKKNRPGVKLSVLCRTEDVESIETILFTETTTLGVRRYAVRRHVLSRQPHSVKTQWGQVDGKIGWLRTDCPRFAPEFESCRRIAAEQNVPLRAVYEAAEKAFDAAAVVRQ